MSNASRFFSNLREQILLSINTSMPCKVLSYNKGNRTAKIQPLFKVKEVGQSPESLPSIEDVPVCFQKFEVDGITKTYTPILGVGDIVLVVFGQRSIDDAIEGVLDFPGFSRVLDIQDAMIVGILK